MSSKAPSTPAGGRDRSAHATLAVTQPKKKVRVARRWRSIKRPREPFLAARIASMLIAFFVFSSSLTPVLPASSIILPFATASPDVSVSPSNNEEEVEKHPLEPGTVSFRNTPPESTTSTVQEGAVYSNLKMDNKSYSYDTHVGTYQFSKEKPFQYSYNYNLDSSQHVNSSLFWVQTVEKTVSTGASSNETLQGADSNNATVSTVTLSSLTKGNVTRVAAQPNLFEVTVELLKENNKTFGYLTTRFEPLQHTPKFTAIFRPPTRTISGGNATETSSNATDTVTNMTNYRIVWAVSTEGKYLQQQQEIDLPATDLQNLNTSKQVYAASNRLNIGFSSNPDSWRTWTVIDWSDFGSIAATATAAAASAKVSSSIGPIDLGSIFRGQGVLVAFPDNASYVDPIVIGQSTSAVATGLSFQRKTFYYQQYHYAFFYNGSNILYRTSQNGSSWNTAVSVGSGTISSTWSFSLFQKGSTVALAWVGSDDKSVYFKKGTLNGPSISWSSTVNVWSNSGGNTAGGVNVAIDTNGYFWVAAGIDKGAPGYALRAWKSTDESSFTSMGNLWGGSSPQSGSYLEARYSLPTILPLPSGKVQVAATSYWSAGQPGPYLRSLIWNGSSWSQEYNLLLNMSKGVTPYNNYSATADTSGNIHLLYTDSYAWVEYAKFSQASKTWYGSTVLSVGATKYPSISRDDLDIIYASWIEGGKINLIRNFTSWESAETYPLGDNFDSPAYLSAAYNFSAYYSAVWREASSSPYNVRFGMMPTLPDSWGSPIADKPWDKEGLVPYGQYFAQISEYVSPGNGLLVVKQTDFALSGRGMDLAVSRVFVTPKLFLNSAPYAHPAYPWANLGDGWELNFPWIDDYNYLHLWDGQRFLINYTGNVFENHNGQHFKFYHNANGTYILYLKDGTRLNFDSSKKLTNIVDRTGNNTITFTYSSNKISYITDTVGRKIYFSYNAQNRVSGFSSSNRVVNYTYTNGKLTSVSDPAGRRTNFTYTSSVNSWLISGVKYPSGANTTYTYDSAGVGAKAVTYPVTLQNVYAGGVLDRSTSFSYNVVNGYVSKSQVQQSGGSPQDGAGWLSGWNYRKSHVITNASGAGTNYPIKIVVNKGSGLDSGQSVFLGNSALNWPNDIRFTGNDGVTALDYWTESSDNSTATFWVEVKDDLSSASATIYIYYGNTGASSASNGDSTFSFFDDFSGSSLNTTKWNSPHYVDSGTTSSVHDGLLDFSLTTGYAHTGGSAVSKISVGPSTQSYTVTAKVKQTNYYSSAVGAYVGFTNAATYNDDYYGYPSNMLSANLYDYTSNGWYLQMYFNTYNDRVYGTNSTTIRNLWFRNSLFYSPATYIKGTFEQLESPFTTQSLTKTSSGGVNPTYVVLGQGDYNTAEHTYFDYVFARKSLSTEPSQGIWGLREVPADLRTVYDYSSSSSGSLGGWNNRKSHLINSASGAGTNYQIKIVAHKGVGTDSGENIYLNNQALNWPNDIRFTGNDGLTLLDHWMESSDSNTATFWVEVKDDLSLMSTTIYIYYGQSGASSASSGSNTFAFFDDFSGSSLDSSKWSQTSGSSTVSNSIVTVSDNSRIDGKTNFGLNYAAHFRSQYASWAQDYGQVNTGFRGEFAGLDSNALYIYAYNGGSAFAFVTRRSGSTSGVAMSETEDNNWHTFKYYRVSSTSAKAQIDDGTVKESTSNVPTASLPLTVEVRPSFTGTVKTDWVFVRKYVSPEPSHGSLGDGETFETSVTVYDSVNAKLKEIKSLYDENSNPLQEAVYIGISTQVAYVTTYLYDNWGNVIKARDALGHYTYYSYINTNSQNQFNTTGFTNSFYNNSVNGIIHNRLAGSANYQNGTGSAKQESYFKYDSAGNLVQTKVLHNGGWIYTNQTYDQYGHLISATDALGRTMYSTYSSAYGGAYLTETRILVGGSNVTTSFGYNFDTGYLMNTTSNGARTTSYEYDILGRRTKVTLPAVNGVRANRTFTYFDSNSTVAMYDAKGNMTKQYYDQLGRLIKTALYNGTSVLYSNSTQTNNWRSSIVSAVTVMGNQFTSKYDSLGRLVNATSPNGTFNTVSYFDVNMTRVAYDAKGNKTLAQYDYLGRLVLARSYLNSTYYYATTYSYDQVGNLLKTVDPKSQITTYVYDDLNRLTRTNLPDGSYVSKSYNSVGNVVSAVDRNGYNVTYTYDEASRLTKIRYPNGTWTEYRYNNYGERTFMNNTNATYYYQYDNLSRLINQTQITSGSTFTTLYSYDIAGNMVSVTYHDGSSVAYTYDFLNRVKRVGSYANFTYFKDGRVSTVKYGNGISTSYTYDTLRRISRILTSRPNGSSLLDLSYGYDKVGNILSINSETYGYDALNRLASSSGPWGSTSYTYDQVGNRLTKTEGGTTVTYTYGSYNRLTSSNNPQTSYTYDNDGNMLGRSGGGTTWNYTFAWSDHLTQVKKNSSVVAQYYYDGDGGRVKIVEGSVTTLYGAGFEKITTNNTLVKIISGNGMIARIVNGTVRYYHANHIGSTRLVTNSSGGVVFNSNYKPFGAQVNQTGTDPFKFQGKHEDSPTGLYYFSDNYYDPDLGRYISNSFVFAGNNPLGGSTTSVAMNIDMSTGVNRNYIPNKWKQYAVPASPAPASVTQTSTAPPATPSVVADPAPTPAPSAGVESGAEVGAGLGAILVQDTTLAIQPYNSPKTFGILEYFHFMKERLPDVSSRLLTDYKGGVGVNYGSATFTSYPPGNMITLSEAGYYNAVNPNWGAIIHELAHVVLWSDVRVGGWGWLYTPSNWWIHEGVADYVRYKLNFFYGEEPWPGDTLLFQDPKTGYKSAAYFVDFWESNRPGWLNRILNEQSGNPGISPYLQESYDIYWTERSRYPFF